MKSTITQVLFFIKDMCTLSLWSKYWTLSMLNLHAFVCVCVWGGGAGGCFYVVVFNAIFFEFRVKHQNFTEFERISSWTTFLTRIFSYSILKVILCTSKRTQLQQKLEMSVFFLILSWFCLFVLNFCVAANIFAAMTPRFLSTQVEPVLSRE